MTAVAVAADPLAGLDDVPWGDFTHAYGPADDVPGLLRELASGSPERAEGALDALFGNVWHQGTVYPATPHAVPFLLRILERGTGSEREDATLAMLLAEIADGHGYMLVHHGGMPSLRSTFEKVAADQGTTVEAMKAEERSIIDACRAAVAAGAELLVPFLRFTGGGEDGEASVRESVATGLARCVTYRPDLKEPILTAFDAETDPDFFERFEERDLPPWFAEAAAARRNRLNLPTEA